MIDILVQPSKNPRGQAPYKKIDELASSLGDQGQVHPLLVRPHPSEEGKWLLIAGYRRYAAAQKLGWETIEVKVKHVDDLGARLLALTENAQREDVDPYVEAEEWQSIIDTFTINQADLARRLGVSEASVSIRLKTLRESSHELRKAVQEGEVQFSTAREMCNLPVTVQRDMVATIRKNNANGIKTTAAQLKRIIEDKNHEKALDKCGRLLAKDETIASRVEEGRKKAHPRATKELLDQWGMLLTKQKRSQNERAQFRLECQAHAIEWALGLRPSP